MKHVLKSIVVFLVLAVACAKGNGNTRESLAKADKPVPTPSGVAQLFLPDYIVDARHFRDIDAQPGTIRTAALTTDFQRKSGGPTSASEGPASTYVIASYTNTLEGVVRLIQKTGDTWRVMQEWQLAGSLSFPELEMMDLLGDGTPVIRARFAIGARNEFREWLFVWNRDHLESLTPGTQPNDTEPVSGLDADYADINGDGVLEILNAVNLPDADGDTPTDRTGYDLYRLEKGRFVRVAAVGAYETFTLRRGKTNLTETREFSIPTDQVKNHYTMRIVRGGKSVNGRVKKAEVFLNGAPVAGLAYFRQDSDVISVPVSLLAVNELKVDVQEGKAEDDDKAKKDQAKILANIIIVITQD